MALEKDQTIQHFDFGSTRIFGFSLFIGEVVGGGPHLLYRYEENEREQKTESYSTREYVYSLDRYGRMGVRGGVIGISN